MVLMYLALHKEDLFTVAADPKMKKHLEQGGEIDLTVIDNPHAVAGQLHLALIHIHTSLSFSLSLCPPLTEK
jgi:hypothetical protein